MAFGYLRMGGWPAARLKLGLLEKDGFDYLVEEAGSPSERGGLSGSGQVSRLWAVQDLGVFGFPGGTSSSV